MKVEQFLNERGVTFQLLQHESAYAAQRIAQTLHVPGQEMAKTVLLRTDGGQVYVVSVLPATHHVDLELASRALGGSRVELASEAELAERCSDCELGVLPPFGSQYGMKTLVDSSLAEDEEIVFEGNTHEEAIRLRFEDFRTLEQPIIAHFARKW